ncbi:type I secretion membrane fusion protein, HlyD family [Arcobacter nitrofigilis DSM 7299]|uniref:Type I secretion membrane fusion protein, HlyD family n=1 Tax=Arcobacter nitrofigilis (strain ATCC 33309 / DSM 7299 / CCUG 15893 / LMG 7604 / NCTC 12251 / CI) TaxID=572480 RepID=D5V6G2_ARCNC|nr:HlyD family type I secretion periplasmic adaptor subunit [Arcobacter nitrofigilis]ADG94232.1 type I secretion membrane fusion protein, HlyD family [Arcobacter nitrofigilis DSM 7299]
MAKEDIDFIYSLHAQANLKTNKKVDYLFVLIVGFFVAFFIWASFSKIDELARGQGKVIPSEKIQTIQSLDGGIISEILVKEGATVVKGQALMKIDTTRFRASLDEDQQSMYSLEASKVRLEAETKLNIRDKDIKLVFPKDLEEKSPKNVKHQREFFITKVDELKSALNILETQLGQKVQELIELQSKRDNLEGSMNLLNEQYKTVQKFVKAGSKSTIDLIAVKKELNTTRSELESTKIQIPKAKYAIDESKNRILEKLKSFRSEAFQELEKVNSDLKIYESKVVSGQDKVNKTVIESPVNGIIKQININTIGGVVRSGVDLIEIVPQSDILLVEAKIDPKDIAFINPKQRAIVKVTAYDFSIYGALEGKIVEISADSIVDKESKVPKSYYKVVVKTNKNYLERNGEKLPIIPGMVASVDIITGQKTILDFILKPILKTKQDALHER